jgi:hypothetical protein
MELFLIVSHWPEDSATKLKRGQLNVVCTSMYGVRYSFPPFCMKFVLDWRHFLSVVDNSKVWSI